MIYFFDVGSIPLNENATLDNISNNQFLTDEIQRPKEAEHTETPIKGTM